MTNNGIAGDSVREFTVKGSRFIGYAKVCRSESSFRRILVQLRDEHPRANHIAYAYRVISKDENITRCSDDGEPSGTAGKPILAHLDGRKLANIAVYVVRYFGGTKLGTGGLARSYSEACRLCLEAAQIEPIYEMMKIKLELDYADKSRLDHTINKFQATLLSCDYQEKITCSIHIKRTQYNEFNDFLDETIKIIDKKIFD